MDEKKRKKNLYGPLNQQLERWSNGKVCAGKYDSSMCWDPLSFIRGFIILRQNRLLVYEVSLYLFILKDPTSVHEIFLIYSVNSNSRLSSLQYFFPSSFHPWKKCGNSLKNKQGKWARSTDKQWKSKVETRVNGEGRFWPKCF